MKKLFAFALCCAAVASVSAQKKSVDAAQKLVGNDSKVTEARALIKGAFNDPETQNDARTYFVAGAIEQGLYDNSYKKLMINRDDPKVDKLGMCNALIQAFKYYMKALPLDSLPDAKGKVKPKYSKDIANAVGGHAGDYFNAGGTFFNEKKYFPQAYEAFMIYGDLPVMPFFGKNAPAIPDSVRGTAYFNAGLAAYSGNQVEKSAEAFAKAYNNGYTKPEAYIYEIACYQALAQRDTTKIDYAGAKICEVARAGYQKFGLQEPLFITNVVNSLVLDNKFDEAYSIVNKEITANPDNSMLLSLRGFVYDRNDKDAESEADYRKAAEMPDANFETLKNAARKIAHLGTEKWNLIEGNSAEARAARQELKTNYFEKALEIAHKAEAMNPGDSAIRNTIENLEYSLQTYF